VKFFHIFTAGTSEADEVGIQIEVDLQKLLAKFPEPVPIGPNCMGVYCPAVTNLFAIFHGKPAHISLIFHSATCTRNSSFMATSGTGSALRRA